jgi:hypothetical protein
MYLSSPLSGVRPHVSPKLLYAIVSFPIVHYLEREFAWAIIYSTKASALPLIYVIFCCEVELFTSIYALISFAFYSLSLVCFYYCWTEVVIRLSSLKGDSWTLIICKFTQSA